MLDKLARAYLEEIVWLHGVPSPIVLDQDTRFQSRFWQKLQEAFGTLLHFNIAFHAATNGQNWADDSNPRRHATSLCAGL